MSIETLTDVYKSAIYKAAGVAFTLSEQLWSEENQKRNEELERDLKQLGQYTPSTGEGPDGTWVEEGFAVFGIGLEQALELGRKYGQGEGERVALGWCESGGLEEFFALLRNTIVSKLPHDLYELINIYRRVDGSSIRVFRCFHHLFGKGYVVQQCDFSSNDSVRQILECRDMVDFYFPDAMFSQNPEERQHHKNLEEAIAAFLTSEETA